MKLGAEMSSEKPQIITIPVVEEKPAKAGWSTQKKLIVGVVLGLVTLVVVTAVVIVAVYFGSKLSAENFKTARQTFATDDGKVTDEETTVSKDSVTVKVPNEVEIVYDYTHGLVVERYVNSETKAKSACFARYMNASRAPSRDAGDYGNNGEVSLTSPTSSSGGSEQWVSTNKLVPRYMISENVDKMCQGTNIYWMEQKETDGTEKRATRYLYSTASACIKFSNYPCLYYCKVVSVYYDDVYRVYIFVTSYGYYCDVKCAPYYSYCK